MQRAGQLLAILLAAILSMSALASTIIPAATVFPAFAEEHEEEDDDNSGSGSGSDDDESEDEAEDEEESEDESEDEMEEEDDDDNSGHGSDDSDESEDEAEDEAEDEQDDEEDESEESEAEDEHEDEMEDQDDHSKTKLKADDDGVEVEVEKEGLDLDDGLYDVTFSCTDPAVSMDFEDGLEVEDGEGDFEANIALEAGTYSGCEVTVDDPEMTLASFDSFTVSVEEEHEEEESEDDDSDDERGHQERVKEHREERVHDAQNIVHSIRERIANAQPSSPGPVVSGMNYTLTAAGMTEGETVQNATASLELVSWKSTPAIAILAVVGGEVEVGDTDYTVLIGYAIYSLGHDAVRVNALAVDEASGDVIKVTLRGGALEDVEFPDASGESVELHFEGSSGPQNNKIAGFDVILDGDLEAE